MRNLTGTWENLYEYKCLELSDIQKLGITAAQIPSDRLMYALEECDEDMAEFILADTKLGFPGDVKNSFEYIKTHDIPHHGNPLVVAAVNSCEPAVKYILNKRYDSLTQDAMVEAVKGAAYDLRADLMSDIISTWQQHNAGQKLLPTDAGTLLSMNEAFLAFPPDNTNSTNSLATILALVQGGVDPNLSVGDETAPAWVLTKHYKDLKDTAAYKQLETAFSAAKKAEKNN